jgi:hypothetical protein
MRRGGSPKIVYRPRLRMQDAEGLQEDEFSRFFEFNARKRTISFIYMYIGAYILRKNCKKYWVCAAYP